MRSLTRRLRGLSPTPGHVTVAKTAELRLAEVQITPRGVVIDVEVRASPLLPVGLPAWSGAEVRLGIHWMGADGSTVIWDGPRSETVPLQWLELTPFRRNITLPSPPAGATELRVELVAEGIAWGEALGLAPLRFPVPGVGGLTPSTMEPNPRGPKVPEEAPADTRAWLSAGWPQDANPQEMANYVGADLARFLMSIQLMPEHPGRILEVGSNPYFISRLVQKRYPECELRMTNYFGSPGEAMEQNIVDVAGEVLTCFRSELVDTEIMRLPYDDASFDTVLLCEVIEHLIKDPVFQLAEIARVLRPGGTFILTTPNVARAGNRHRLAQRQGIHDPYSSYGPHGRHNREYTAEELLDLVTSVGFTPVTYLTRPVHGVAEPDVEWFRAADDDGSGDYHFLLMQRDESDVCAPVRPSWLYR
jgi:SAM-dependent methyltransferase